LLQFRLMSRNRRKMSALILSFLLLSCLLFFPFKSFRRVLMSLPLISYSLVSWSSSSLKQLSSFLVKTWKEWICFWLPLCSKWLVCLCRSYSREKRSLGIEGLDWKKNAKSYWQMSKEGQKKRH
jgi:hypothetical protein